MNKGLKRNQTLDMRVLFEPNRLESKSLAEAYQQVVPISKRRLPLANSINSTVQADKRMVGGAA